MARFEVKIRVENGKNQGIVKIGVCEDHLVGFHEVRSWDDDAKNKLGLKSGRGMRYSTDFGHCGIEAPDFEFIETLVKAKFPEAKVVLIDGNQPQPKPQPTAMPKPKIKKTQKLPEPQQFSAASAMQATQVSSGNATDALSALFGGIQQDITNNVLTAIEPFINSVQRVEISVNLPNIQTVINHRVHEKFEYCLKKVQAGMNLYLFGPTGSGKSRIAQDIAEAMQLEYHQQDKVTYVHELVGMMDAHGNFHPTPLFLGWTQGGVVCLDEFDAYAPDAAIKLNGALSQGVMVFADGKAYKKHPDCHIIATGNTNGTGPTEQYVTRYCGDASNYGRFRPITIDYSRPIELDVCNNDVDLVDFVHQVRQVCKAKNDILLAVDYRAIKQMYVDSQLESCEDAIEGAIVNRLDTDTAKLLLLSLPEYESQWFKAARNIANML